MFQVPLFTSGGLGLGLKNLVLFTSLIKLKKFGLYVYADDVLLLAPSVSSLQLILAVCEKELHRLDMMNVKKSLCLRIGPRHKVKCSNIVASDSNVISWSNAIRYLGVNIVTGHKFTCSLDNCKRSFYRAFNAIFGKVGRIA